MKIGFAKNFCLKSRKIRKETIQIHRRKTVDLWSSSASSLLCSHNGFVSQLLFLFGCGSGSLAAVFRFLHGCCCCFSLCVSTSVAAEDDSLALSQKSKASELLGKIYTRQLSFLQSVFHSNQAQLFEH